MAMTMFQNVFKLNKISSVVNSGVGRFFSFAATHKLLTGFENQIQVGNVRSPIMMMTPAPPVSLLYFEQKRYFWGNEGRIGWRRKRAKALREREKILHPSSPVIDHRVPWPIDDTELLPSDLFGREAEEEMRAYQEKANFMQNSILGRINGQLSSKSEGRLFAVVHISGKQFKVTPEDVIIIQGQFAPNTGDQLRLHKVLLVGSKDFTLIGHPLIEKDFVRVEATVIEKTLSYTKMNFVMKAKKRFRRLRFYKDPYTMLRINLIEVMQPLSSVVPSDSEFQSCGEEDVDGVAHQKFNFL